VSYFHNFFSNRKVNLMKNLSLLFLAFLFAMLIAFCSQESKLIGKWELSDVEMIDKKDTAKQNLLSLSLGLSGISYYDFSPDEIRWYNSKGKLLETIKYQLSKDEKRITLNETAGTNIFPFEWLSKDEFSITSKDAIFKFKRKK